MQKTGIGIDFGNSHSTIAVFDGSYIKYITLESDKKQIFTPTAITLDKEYRSFTGQNALNKYMSDNTGRFIRPVKKEIACIPLEMGEMDRDYYVERNRNVEAVLNGYFDENLPSRLFLSLKSLIGHSNINRFRVFDKQYRIEALLTPILNSMGDRIERKRDIHIGRPVHYSGCSNTAMERMNCACSNSGFENIKFFHEPEAAALSYIQEHNLKSSEIFLVFDFGGGTLDLSLIKVSENKRFQVLGNSGLAMAGDEINRILYRNLILPLLGKGIELADGGRSYKFPFDLFESHLLNWQSSYILNQPLYISKITDAIKKAGSEDINRLMNLKAVIKNNSSFEIFACIEEAKRALSSSDSYDLSLPFSNQNLLLYRLDLERQIEPLLKQIQEKIQTLMEETGLKSSQVGRVVCTGGSSQIPAVQDMLESLFPEKLESYNLYTSIAAGLAIASWKSHEPFLHRKP